MLTKAFKFCLVIITGELFINFIPRYENVYVALAQQVDMDSWWNLEQVENVCGHEVPPNHRTDASTPSGSEPGMWPWMACLMMRDLIGQSFCGGLLISHQYVLTGAHCVGGRNPADIIVRLGTKDCAVDPVLTGPSNEWITGARDYEVDTLQRHHDFTTYPAIINDLALIKLSTHVIFNYTINPICLPPGGYGVNGYAGHQATLIEWGKSDKLHEINLQVLSNQVCQDRVVNFAISINDNYVCAGNGSGSWSGHSGGPLMYKSPATNRWRIIGVKSRRFYPGVPNFFTRRIHAGKITTYAVTSGTDENNTSC